MDQISIDPRSEHAYETSKARLNHLVNSFNTSENSNQLAQNIKDHFQKIKGVPDNKPNYQQTQKKASWLTSLYILVKRSYKNLFRTPVIIITRLMQVLSFGIILSLCYLRIETDQIGVQNMQGFLYECLALLFVGLLNAVAICK